MEDLLIGIPGQHDPSMNCGNLLLPQNLELAAQSWLDENAFMTNATSSATVLTR